MDRKKHRIGKIIGYIGMLVGAAVLGFVVCVVIRYFIDKKGIPTELLYGEERSVSEFQEFFYDDPDASLKWTVDSDIIEIDGQGKDGIVRAVGIGTSHVTVTDTLLEAIGGDSVVFSFNITVSFREDAVDSAVRTALGLGKEDKIPKEALLSLSALDLSGTDLASCGDLVPMTGLNTVDLSACRALKDVSALYDSAFCAKEADLSGAGITAIDLSRLSPSIKKIDVSGTELTSLSFAGSRVKEIVAEELIFTADVTIGESDRLEKLSFRGTQFPSLTMNEQFPALTALDLGETNILGGLTLSADFPALSKPEFGGMTVRGSFTLGGSFEAMASLQLKDATLNSLYVSASLPAVTSAEIGATLKEGLTFSPTAPLLSSVSFTGVNAKGSFSINGNYPKMKAIALGSLEAEGGLTISGTYAGAEHLYLDGVSTANVTVLASLPSLKNAFARSLTAKNVSFNASTSATCYDLTGASIGGEARFQSAPALTELLLGGAEISSLSLTGDFGSLTALTAENAQIGTLSLSGAELPLLTEIALPQAGIGTADLPWGNAPQLSGIDLSGNRLQSFAMPAAGSSSLVSLDLSGNALSFFSVGGNFPAMQTLSLGGNHLSTFTLSAGLEKLAALSVGCETLTNLSLDGTFPGLKTVNCTGANAVAVSLKGEYDKLDALLLPATVSSLTLDGTFSALRSVEGGGSQIKGASFAGTMKGLTKIDLSEAGLAWIELNAEFPNLEELLLGGAALDSLVLSGNYPKLGQLDLNNVTTTAAGVSIEGEYPALKEFNAQNMRVSGNVELKNNGGKYNLDLSGLQAAGSQAPSLSFKEGNSVLTFSFGGAQLSTLTAVSLPELVTLDGSSANVITADFSDMPKLTTCTLKSSDFDSLKFSGEFDALVGLNFKEANIVNLKVSADFADLESFSAENTSMGSADFNGAVFEKLTSLDLSGNRLTSFTLNFTADKMSRLDLSDNRLTAFSVADGGRYESLKDVDIGGNGSSSAALDLTLGGELPALDSFTFAGSTFGTIALNGTFEGLEKISLSNVTFKKVIFDEKWHPVSKFTVAFTETEEYVYGNLPMPVPFSLTRAGNADELKDIAKNADTSTLVCAAFDESFGGELAVASSAEKFGLYGKSSFRDITLRPTNGAAKLYFYNVTLSNESGSVINLQSASSAELHFYGTCSLERSGAGTSEATIVGKTVSLVSNNILEIHGRNGADATAAGSNGGAGGTAISCTGLSFGGSGNIRIWGGNGGNGMKGADGVSGTATLDGSAGGAGGAGGLAVSVAGSVTSDVSSLQIYGGDGGNGADGGKSVEGISRSKAADGKNLGDGGANGDSGTNGSNGGAGGNGAASGSAIKGTNLNVTSGSVVLHSGNGGYGGDGNDGGAGGAGGAGGNGSGGYNGWWHEGDGGNGGNGGAGGNGGTGGAGGNSSAVLTVDTLIVFAEGSLQLLQGSAGNGGAGGDGGKGGAGGNGGNGTVGKYAFKDSTCGSGGSGGVGGSGSAGGSGGEIFDPLQTSEVHNRGVIQIQFGKSVSAAAKGGTGGVGAYGGTKGAGEKDGTDRSKTQAGPGDDGADGSCPTASYNYAAEWNITVM